MDSKNRPFLEESSLDGLEVGLAGRWGFLAVPVDFANQRKRRCIAGTVCRAIVVQSSIKRLQRHIPKLHLGITKLELGPPNSPAPAAGGSR